MSSAKSATRALPSSASPTSAFAASTIWSTSVAVNASAALRTASSLLLSSSGESGCWLAARGAWICWELEYGAESMTIASASQQLRVR